MPRRKSTVQINFRIDPAYAREITKAAKLVGKSVGQFLQDAARPEVDRLLQTPQTEQVA